MHALTYNPASTDSQAELLSAISTGVRSSLAESLSYWATMTHDVSHIVETQLDEDRKYRIYDC